MARAVLQISTVDSRLVLACSRVIALITHTYGCVIMGWHLSEAQDSSLDLADSTAGCWVAAGWCWRLCAFRVPSGGSGSEPLIFAWRVRRLWEWAALQSEEWSHLAGGAEWMVLLCCGWLAAPAARLHRCGFQLPPTVVESHSSPAHSTACSDQAGCCCKLIQCWWWMGCGTMSGVLHARVGSMWAKTLRWPSGSKTKAGGLRRRRAAA